MALRKSSNSAITEYDVKAEQKKTLDFLREYNFNYIPVQAGTKRIDVFAEEDGFGGHNASGYDGNVAIATDKCVALDLDENFLAIKELLGEYGNTFQITRSNAKTRGALLYIISDYQPVSLTLIPEDNKEKSPHPVMELKALTKHKKPERKLICGTYDKGVYISNDVEVMFITLAELNEHIIKPIYEYYGEHPIQAIDSRFVDATTYKGYSSGDKRYDVVVENYTCPQIIEYLGLDYSRHSGDWYKLDVNEHDTIFFNQHAFKHHAANVSGGMLDFYMYITSGFTKLYNEGTPKQRLLERATVVSDLLKHKGIYTEDVAQRLLMDGNSLDEICDYLIELYSNVELWNEELTVIAKTLGISINLLKAMDLEDLAKHKLSCDKRMSAQIRRSSMVIELSNREPSEPFMKIDLDNLETYTEKFVVDDCIAEKDMVLLVGEGGAGKTFFMFHLGLNLALGQSIFGGTYKASHEKSVVYVCAEGRGGLGRRAAGMLKSMGLKALPDNFNIYNGILNLYTGEGLENFELHMLQNNIVPDFIIFDNFRVLAPGADENSASQVAMVQSSMNILAEKYSCATLLIHHVNKSHGEYSGSTAFHSRVDLLLTSDVIQVDESIYGTNKLSRVCSSKVRDGAPMPHVHYSIHSNEIGPYVKEVRYGGMSPLEELVKGSNKTLSVLARNTTVYLKPEVIATLGCIDVEEVNVQLKENAHMVAMKIDDDKDNTYALSKEWLDTKATSY